MAKKTRTASKTTTKLSWEEPPAVTRGARGFNFPADELKANKNSWACLAEVEVEGDDMKTAASRAGGRAGALRARLAQKELTGYEVVSRQNKVFARYTGKAA